jgi:hypothetical protein
VSVENGDTPPLLNQNFPREQIDAAKERVDTLAA